MPPDEPLPSSEPSADVAGSEASAFDQLLARHNQVNQAFDSLRKLFEDLADQEPDPDPLGHIQNKQRAK
jgi:hypothetical protein